MTTILLALFIGTTGCVERTEGDPSLSTSIEAAAVGGGPAVDQAQVCIDYIDCIIVTEPTTATDELDHLGPDGVCWDNADIGAVCEDICDASLEELRDDNPWEQGCFDFMLPTTNNLLGKVSDWEWSIVPKECWSSYQTIDTTDHGTDRSDFTADFTFHFFGTIDFETFSCELIDFDFECDVSMSKVISWATQLNGTFTKDFLSGDMFLHSETSGACHYTGDRI
jgi:hypothetical protein